MSLADLGLDGDPVTAARALLGARLVHANPERGECSAIIVETEAYGPEEDLACHAKVGLTPRTSVMYGPCAHAYVYLIYGMYHMLNVTVWPEGKPGAVLIRAVEPITGCQGSTQGPGRLTRAMGIDMTHNKLPFTGSVLSLHRDRTPNPDAIVTTPRVGVDYAGDWAQKPWRFYLHGNLFVSRK